jgi:carbon-monoxide dehydrogenase medium subunit
MKPAPFAYHDPHTTAEAVALLATHGDDAKVLAGGQSLMPMLNFRLARPGVLVDINRVAELDYLREEGDALAVGALARQRALERWSRSRFPLLAEALRHVGHAAIRTRGTVAGSLAHADPAAELPALFLALDGVAVAVSRGSRREIAARDFFLAPLTTALRPDELLAEVRLPRVPPGSGWSFLEVARRHGDFALVGVVAALSLGGERVESARVALFGCGPTPVRAREAERALVGERPSAAVLERAAEAGTRGLDPPSDLHATAAYRARVSQTLIARALAAAVERARGGGG